MILSHHDVFGKSQIRDGSSSDDNTSSMGLECSIHDSHHKDAKTVSLSDIFQQDNVATKLIITNYFYNIILLISSCELHIFYAG